MKISDLSALVGEVVTVQLNQWYQPETVTAVLAEVASSGAVQLEGPDRYRLTVRAVDINAIEIEHDVTLRERHLRRFRFPRIEEGQ